MHKSAAKLWRKASAASGDISKNCFTTMPPDAAKYRVDGDGGRCGTFGRGSAELYSSSLTRRTSTSKRLIFLDGMGCFSARKILWPKAYYYSI